MTDNFIQVTPFICVDDIEAALGFFVDILGFEAQFRMSNFAYVHRETVGFRLLEQAGPMGSPPGNRRYAYYIDVHDVDRLHRELAPRLAVLPAGDVHGPVDQEYGQRELLVKAPDGNLLVFGQSLAKSP